MNDDVRPTEATEAGGVPARDELAYRLRQQSLLVELGLAALRGGSFDRLLDETVRLTALGVQGRFCKVLEYRAVENRFLVRAGIGWRSGVVGVATVGADLESPAGYAFHTGEPVISNQLSSESRFRTPELLAEHGIHRAANVIIKGEGRPFGVLEVDSQIEGRFDDRDLDFLQAMANVVGVAIERQRLDDRQLALTAELDHRVKNVLATVQAIARQTFRGARDPTAAEDAFNARLLALSRAHDLLSRGAWGSTSLRHLVAQMVAPYDSRRVRFEGPDISISAKITVNLGLIIEELATNAVKYGALSVPGGRVEIEWRLAEDKGEIASAEIIWRERGGPPVGKPTHRGFGTRLIEAGAAAELSAAVKLTFAQLGLECQIELPLSRSAASRGRG